MTQAADHIRGKPRRTLAQLEAQLGRPCPHGPPERREGYCSACSNSVSQRVQKQRDIERMDRRIAERYLASKAGQL